ncbi:BamA/TamA family outer membrane protein [Oligoflexus tunisiensis]|uniref:BamA/TamA family outer membrane protein n=1 Tax=Oligoflexus tunisiensis TaxID=708132 RepID=UPI00114CDA48|nr:BamA/TamA family outer membrane protein [Oligoflexus tunisiensis]
MRVVLVLLSWLCFCPKAAAAPASSPPASFSRLLPVLFYTPDTGLGAGAFLIRNLDEPDQGDPSQLVAFATLTQRKQIISRVEPKIYWDAGRWEWSAQLSAQDFPSEYYGRGSVELHPDDPEAYEDKSFSVETRLKHMFYQHLFWEFELGTGWQRFTAQHDEPTPLVDAEFARWGHKSQQQNLALALGHDSRPSRVRPTTGHLLRILYRHQRFQTNTDEGHFGMSGLDWKQYVTLNPRQSLAFQLAAAQMDQVEVPFYFLLGLGGNQVLRGFYGNQFRDHAISYGQAEWRTLWAETWGFRIFAGVGAHAERLTSLEEASGQAAGGVGIDYFLDRKSMNNLRLDLGFSQDNVGVYFLYGNAF